MRTLSYLKHIKQSVEDFKKSKKNRLAISRFWHIWPIKNEIFYFYKFVLRFLS